MVRMSSQSSGSCFLCVRGVRVFGVTVYRDNSQREVFRVAFFVAEDIGGFYVKYKSLHIYIIAGCRVWRHQLLLL